MQRVREGDVPGPAGQTLGGQPQGQDGQQARRRQKRVRPQDLSQVRYRIARVCVCVSVCVCVCVS